MDGSSVLTDPTDWLQTPTPQLCQVEAALRCQICKDWYDTPMITSCSHTFCSLCIRRCLTNDGICPVCRAPDQEVRLRRNGTVAELVDAFQVARPALVQLGKDRQLAASESSQRKSKRKFDESRSDESGNGDGHCTRQRKTRSQTAAASKAHHVEAINTAEVDDQNGEYQPEDGLIPCPICNQRMKEEDVFAHLDVHNEPDFTPGTKPSISSMRISTDGSTRTQSSRPPDRLPQLSYSLLKDVALRKKLTDLGIPSGGSRALMIRRHTEWVNMVNANSDSARPRSKSELLHELRVWDKSQGRQIPNAPEDAMGASSVMRKDFDGTAWATSHDDDFQRLISKARQKVADKSAHKSHDAPVPHYETDNQETANQSRGISFHASSSPQGFNPPDSSRGVQSPKPDGEAPMPQQCDDQGNI